jgi:hypothetical protein
MVMQCRTGSTVIRQRDEHVSGLWNARNGKLLTANVVQCAMRVLDGTICVHDLDALCVLVKPAFQRQTMWYL